jgi:hypothetical protein
VRGWDLGDQGEMSPLSKMIVRLFAAPILLLASAPFLYGLLAWFVPALLAGSPVLASLAQLSSTAASDVAGAVFIAAISVAALFTRRFRKWQSGSLPYCRSCGGMVVERARRRRIYHHCLLCNHKTSIT